MKMGITTLTPTTWQGIRWMEVWYFLYFIILVLMLPSIVYDILTTLLWLSEVLLLSYSAIHFVINLSLPYICDQVSCELAADLLVYPCPFHSMPWYEVLLVVGAKKEKFCLLPVFLPNQIGQRRPDVQRRWPGERGVHHLCIYVHTNTSSTSSSSSPSSSSSLS